MASVLGFPLEDIPQLAAWGDAVVTPFVHGDGLRHELTPEQTEDMLARLDGFQDYIYEHVTAKRRDPQDDMVSFLCDVHYEALDRKLTDLEIAGIVHAMIIGGLETTQYALEEQAQLLCEHPGTFEHLRTDRTKLRNFVEETMRMRSPTHGLSTAMTAQDEVFQGVEVPAGSLLHLRFGAANVDEEEFACPFDLDLDREARDPPRDVLDRTAGLSRRHPVAHRAADRLGCAARPARVDRVRRRQRLAAPTRDHARDAEAEPRLPQRRDAAVTRNGTD